MDDIHSRPSTSKCEQPNTSSASAYELTAGPCAGAGSSSTVTGACALVTSSLHPPPLAVMHDPRKRKPSQSQYSSDGYDMADCDGMHAPGMQPAKRKPSSFSDYDMSVCDSQSMLTPASMMSPVSSSSKRRASSYGASSTYEDDGGDETRSIRTLPDKKQNHSEIEKRRRDKMNTYITELSTMVPMCGAMARKLDKITVLRMAVQYMRTVRGALSACPLATRPRPAYLGERELNALVLQAARDCFLLVVGCDRGRLLFVSASVKRMLHYDQTELLGQSLFDILHPKDVAKVKEQLSSSDLSPRERLIDAKTMLPVKQDVVAGASRLCPGARRSFFCRIKSRSLPQSACTSTEADSKGRKKQTSDKKYCVVQFTGYLKSWAPAEMSETAEGGDEDACNLSCLVAVGRALADLAPPSPPPAPPACPLEYVSRHATDGKFLFVDQRVTLALGYLPQELLGTSLYEYVGAQSLGGVARAHKSALLSREPSPARAYAFRRKDGTYAHLHSLFKPFRNPWTKDIECLVAKNTVVAEVDEAAGQQEEPAFDMFKQKSDAEMQRLIDSQVESHKIGGAIAEEALRGTAEYSPELQGDALQDAVFNPQCMPNVMYEQMSIADGIMEADADYQVRNNVPLSAAGAAIPPERMLPPQSPPLPSLGLDGNGEAAMAVIMSLLEADAGLGGPVNFSGLPWPLP